MGRGKTTMAMPAFNDTAPTLEHVHEPQSVEETGLDLAFIVDLVLKTIYFSSGITAQTVSDTLCLPFFNIVDKALTLLKREELIEVCGSGGFGELAYQYAITVKGMNRVQEVLARSTYVGPAPVTLETYCQVVAAQAIADVRVGPRDVRQALADLVLDDFTIDCIGQAVNTGRSLFLYGQPGNGKTVLAEHIARLLGGAIYIPHAIVVDSHVIKVLDMHNHVPVPPVRPTGTTTTRLISHDQRWVLCRRPVIIVGGELTLAGLDLIYDEANRFYQAPLQVKANGGLFLIDDFGRQQVSPQELLNRWIVPLEKRLDFLTLHTGKKIELPFDQLIVFSTNLEPKSLVDEAFLRRIQNKIRIGNPTVDQYREIFRRQCQALEVPYNNDGLIYLLKEHYIKTKRELRACQPRDILRQLIGIARYKGVPPSITPELIDMACKTYFAEL
jgi:predicted ATPase with chaperone activity